MPDLSTQDNDSHRPQVLKPTLLEQSGVGSLGLPVKKSMAKTLPQPGETLSDGSTSSEDEEEIEIIEKKSSVKQSPVKSPVMSPIKHQTPKKPDSPLKAQQEDDEQLQKKREERRIKFNAIKEHLARIKKANNSLNRAQTTSEKTRIRPKFVPEKRKFSFFSSTF